jgi:hypothetical protein
MRPLKGVVISITLAAALMAQSQSNKSSPQADKSGQNPAGQAGRAGQADTPQADKPAAQVERPARQASPSTATQADRASTATGGANSRTFTGTIVNATCSQASSLMRSGSFADQSVSSSTSTTTNSTDQSAAASSKSTTAGAKDNPTSSSSTNKDEKSVYDKQREVLRHCPATASITAFAVLTDDGSFYKLDDAGNSQVMSQVGGDSDKHKKGLKNMRVTGTGTVQGDSLKVQSLTKTDKPFGSS